MRKRPSRIESARERERELIAAAAAARGFAYAPYSEFNVGAAVLAGSGEIYSGCNVENISYGLTMCAERVAIGSAVAAGETEILAVAVAADDTELVRPCGACLQVMAEFSAQNDPVAVISASLGGSSEIRPLTDYLPIQFHFDRPGGSL